MKIRLTLLVFAAMQQVFGSFEPSVTTRNPLYSVFLHDCPESPETTKNFILDEYFTGFNLSFEIQDLISNNTITFTKFQESDPGSDFAGAVSVKKLENIDRDFDLLIGSLYSNNTLQISEILENMTIVTVANYRIDWNVKECTDFVNVVYNIITVNCIDSNGNYTLININISSTETNLTAIPMYLARGLNQKSFLKASYQTLNFDGEVFHIVTSDSGSLCRWQVEIWKYNSSVNVIAPSGTLEQAYVEKAVGFSVCLLDVLPIKEEHFVLVTTNGQQLFFSQKNGEPLLEMVYSTASGKVTTKARLIDYEDQLFLFQISQNILFQTQISSQSFRPIETSDYTFEVELTIADCTINHKKLIIEALNQTLNSSMVMIYILETESEVWRASDMFYMNSISSALNTTLIPLIENYIPDSKGFYLRLGQMQNWINQILIPEWRVNETELNDLRVGYKKVHVLSKLFKEMSELSKDIPIFYFNSSYFQVAETSNTTLLNLNLIYPQGYKLNADNLGLAGPSLAYSISGIPSSFKDYDIVGNLSILDICWIEADPLGNIWKLSFDEAFFNLSQCLYNGSALDCDYEIYIENSFDALPSKLMVNAFPLIAIYFGIPGSGIGGLWIGQFTQNNHFTQTSHRWNLTSFIVLSEYNFSSSCVDATISEKNTDFLYCLAFDATSEATSIIAYNLTDLVASNFLKLQKLAIESPALPKGPAFNMMFQIDTYANLILLTNKLTQNVFVYQADFLTSGSLYQPKLAHLTTVKTGIHVMDYMSILLPFVSYRTGVLCLFFETYGIFEEWSINTNASNDPLTFKRETILYGNSLAENQGTFPFGRFSFSPISGNVYLLTSDAIKATQTVFIYNLYEPDFCQANCSSRLPRGIITSNETKDFIWGIQVGAVIQNNAFDLVYLWGMEQTLVIAYQNEPHCNILTGMIGGPLQESTMSRQYFDIEISASSKFTPNIKRGKQVKAYVYYSMQNITVNQALRKEATKINIYNMSNYSLLVQDYFQGSVIHMEIASSELRDTSEGNILIAARMRTKFTLQIAYELPLNEEYTRIISGKDNLYVIGTRGIYIGSKASLFHNQTSKFSLLRFKDVSLLQKGKLVVSKNENFAIFFGREVPYTSIFNPKTRKILFDRRNMTVLSASIIENNTAVLLFAPTVNKKNNTVCTRYIAIQIANLYTSVTINGLTYQELCDDLRLSFSSSSMLVAASSALNRTHSLVYSVFMLISDPVSSKQLFVQCTIQVTEPSEKLLSNCSATSLATLIWDYNVTDMFCYWNSIKIISQNTSYNIGGSDQTTFTIFIGNGNFNSYILTVTRVSDSLFDAPKISKGFVSYLPQSNISLVDVNQNYLLLKIRSNYTNTPIYLPVSEDHLLVYNLSSTQPVLESYGRYSLYGAIYFSGTNSSNYAAGFDSGENMLFQLDRFTSGDSFGFTVKQIFETYEVLIKNPSNVTSSRLSLSALNFVSNETISFELIAIPPKETSWILLYMFLGIIIILGLILIIYSFYWTYKKVAKMVSTSKNSKTYEKLIVEDDEVKIQGQLSASIRL